MRFIERIPKSVALLFWMTLLLGLAYPLAVTGIAQIAFPRQANGSLVRVDGEVRGSALLAQKVESPRYFPARPSATDYAYQGSGATNLAATNARLAQATARNAEAWRTAIGKDLPLGAIPDEMLHASASGLDPDVSLEAALARVDGIAAARGYTDAMKERLVMAIEKMAAESTVPIGPPRVNVTVLNAWLDGGPAMPESR
jgi:K+-transporting ATPase ATPase C chain